MRQREPRGGGLSRLAGLVPVPTREEEVALAKRAKRGDRSARDALVLGNMRMVIKIGSFYVKRTPGLAPEEIANVGVLGLLHAITKYDPESGIRFMSYAQHWVRARMTEHAWAHRHQFGGSRNSQRLRGVPSVASSTVQTSDGEIDLCEQMQHDGPSPLEELESQRRRNLVRWSANVAAKSPLEVAIVGRRLLATDPEVLEDLARSFDCTREWVRQCEHRLKNKIRRLIGERAGEGA